MASPSHLPGLIIRHTGITDYMKLKYCIMFNEIPSSLSVAMYFTSEDFITDNDVSNLRIGSWVLAPWRRIILPSQELEQPSRCNYRL
jgi:hypothetical protein